MPETLKKLIEELAPLSNKERLEAFHELRRHYCIDCGRKEEIEDTDRGMHCPCQNDE